MTPYYADDYVTLYHGDCRELLPSLAFDVLVTDPPYGMEYRSGWSGHWVVGDETTAPRDYVLSRWFGPAMVFGRWDVPHPKADIQLVWDKGDWPGMGDLGKPWGPSHEEIYVFGDGWVGRRRGTVLHHTRVGGNGVHPTEKPVSLMAALIRNCKPEWTILDPFAGSGSTLVAAKSLNRKAIGIEIEERYCEVAANRLRQEVLGLSA